MKEAIIIMLEEVKECLEIEQETLDNKKFKHVSEEYLKGVIAIRKEQINMLEELLKEEN